MKTIAKTHRIELDETAAEHLKSMMATLKEGGSHLSLVPSKAVSWIVSEFAARYFSKDKTRMADALFNRKAFLRSMIKSITDGNNDEIQGLESTLRNLRRGRAAKPAPTNTIDKTPPTNDDV